jgi:hypothetical protein
MELPCSIGGTQGPFSVLYLCSLLILKVTQPHPMEINRSPGSALPQWPAASTRGPTIRVAPSATGAARKTPSAAQLVGTAWYLSGILLLCRVSQTKAALVFGRLPASRAELRTFASCGWSPSLGGAFRWRSSRMREVRSASQVEVANEVMRECYMKVSDNNQLPGTRGIFLTNGMTVSQIS